MTTLGKYNKMAEKNFIFRDWLDKKGMSPLAFARLCKVNHVTIYKLYKGNLLSRYAPAKKIARYSNGEINIEDIMEYQ